MEVLKRVERVLKRAKGRAEALPPGGREAFLLGFLSALAAWGLDKLHARQSAPQPLRSPPGSPDIPELGPHERAAFSLRSAPSVEALRAATSRLFWEAFLATGLDAFLLFPQELEAPDEGREERYFQTFFVRGYARGRLEAVNAFPEGLVE